MRVNSPAIKYLSTLKPAEKDSYRWKRLTKISNPDYRREPIQIKFNFCFHSRTFFCLVVIWPLSGHWQWSSVSLYFFDEIGRFFSKIGKFHCFFTPKVEDGMIDFFLTLCAFDEGSSDVFAVCLSLWLPIGTYKAFQCLPLQVLYFDVLTNILALKDLRHCQSFLLYWNDNVPAWKSWFSICKVKYHIA